MAHILFVTWNGGGNQTPAIGAAQALRRAGNRVSFAGYTSQRARLAEAGFPVTVLGQADAIWARRRAHGPFMNALVAGVFACRAHLRDIDRVLASLMPDLVVIDCLMFAACAALERSQIPAVVLVHSAPGALVPPGGPVEASTLRPLNELRSTAGLPPTASLWSTWSPFPVLCATLPQLDPWNGPRPASFDYIGPILEQQATTWQPSWPATNSRPLILVSFSTGDAWDQTSRIDRTLTALSASPYRVLVTTGMADISAIDVPPNAVLQPHAPHPAVLPHTTVTISHGGHGTMCASLAEAVPMVLLPNQAADQPALAARAAALGVAEVLDGDASPAAISRALQKVIEDHSYHHAAATLAAAIRSADAATAAVLRIEASL